MTYLFLTLILQKLPLNKNLVSKEETSQVATFIFIIFVTKINIAGMLYKKKRRMKEKEKEKKLIPLVKTFF